MNYPDPSDHPSFYDPEHPDNRPYTSRDWGRDEDAAYERMAQYQLDHPEEFEGE